MSAEEIKSIIDNQTSGDILLNKETTIESLFHFMKRNIKQEAEKAFRVGYLRGLWEEGIGRSEEQPTEETYINNLFNNDR